MFQCSPNYESSCFIAVGLGKGTSLNRTTRFASFSARRQIKELIRLQIHCPPEWKLLPRRRTRLLNPIIFFDANILQQIDDRALRQSLPGRRSYPTQRFFPTTLLSYRRPVRRKVWDRTTIAEIDGDGNESDLMAFHCLHIQTICFETEQKLHDARLEVRQRAMRR